MRTIPALINYYHMTMGAPPINTWIKGIDNGWFTSFPGLTSARVRQYCTNKVETAKGHLKLQRQHVQSTQTTSSRRPRSNTHEVSAHIRELKNLISKDLTGRYPITSRRGYKYVLIMVDWDSDYIKLIPLKSRKSDAIVTAYRDAYNWFISHGFRASLLKLDNEVSKLLIDAITTDQLEY